MALKQILATLALLTLLTACYETPVLVIGPQEADGVNLTSGDKFRGYGLTQEGTFQSEPDAYYIIKRTGLHDVIYEDDKPASPNRRLRVRQLEPDLFLFQITPQDQANPRHQLMLVKQEDGAFYVIRPDPYNDKGIDTRASQERFAKKLNVEMSTVRGAGVIRLNGAPRAIRNFMYSLSTLPTQRVYKLVAGDG